MTRLDPQRFRQLAGGTLAQRREALDQLVAAGLAEVTEVQDEVAVRFFDNEHPCVVIFRETRSRQGVQT